MNLSIDRASMSEHCAICDDGSDVLVKLTQKGLKTLLRFSKQRNELEIMEALEKANKANQQIFVHETCRKSFTDKRKISQKVKNRETRSRDASSSCFDFRTDCLFCSKPCIDDKKNPSRKTWVPASTLKLKQAILGACTSRLEINPEDEWGILVKSRTDECIDLVAAKARYHPICRFEFQKHRKINKKCEESSARGRKANRYHMNGFYNACNWLESETELHSLREFWGKAQEFLGDVPA